MSKYNRSAVMSRAWKTLRRFPNLSWRTCMLHSWDIEKQIANDITPVAMNKILNGLRSFNRSRIFTENKPLMAGTQEHFKLLNSKMGRKIMKLPVDNDSKEMLESGELFAMDIINQRRKESMRFKAPVFKPKNKFRNRIINRETCVTINIQEYIDGNNS